jgi:quercetin dioxygenase-like cupin family protein
MERLKELTPTLPPFPETQYADFRYKEYKMDVGICKGWYIFESDGIAVHRWFNSAGTEFPAHTHEEKEWIIVYSGRLIIKKENEDVEVQAGESTYIAPDEVHGAYVPEDTEYITVTIPPVREFPHAK